MAKGKKKYWFILGLPLFIFYVFAAARPIPRETIISPRWLSSLESDFPVTLGPEAEDGSGGEGLIPFRLGDRFGYVDRQGHFAINRRREGRLELSEKFWTQYDAVPETIDIRGPTDETALTIENPEGYPFFLDGQIFLIGKEQNSLTALDDAGEVRWTYDFAAPLTCIDAAAGRILTGTIDGTVEVLDGSGKRLYIFPPGGSRIAVILGCAISRDGRLLGIVSGIDDQRFLVLEQFGGAENVEYKVVYHEFLEDGFRRGLIVSFIDDNRWIIFERQGGLGVYEINTRRSYALELDGDIVDVNGSGDDGLLFVVSSQSARQKRLVVVRLPGRIVAEAPFKSGTAFLGREDRRLYVGGGSTLASFELEKK
ncbi:MAG: WD40 repeat domain-containing protein [Treponema sp.]|nr:WD40 repeat domain-containing protein [Treponema sp.]